MTVPQLLMLSPNEVAAATSKLEKQARLRRLKAVRIAASSRTELQRRKCRKAYEREYRRAHARAKAEYELETLGEIMLLEREMDVAVRYIGRAHHHASMASSNLLEKALREKNAVQAHDFNSSNRGVRSLHTVQSEQQQRNEVHRAPLHRRMHARQQEKELLQKLHKVNERRRNRPLAPLQHPFDSLPPGFVQRHTAAAPPGTSSGVRVEPSVGSTRFHQAGPRLSAFELAQRERERAVIRQQENAERYRHRDSLAQHRGQQASLYVRDRQRGAETEQVLHEATVRDRQQKLEHARKRALDDENHMLLRGRKQAAEQNKLDKVFEEALPELRNLRAQHEAAISRLAGTRPTSGRVPRRGWHANVLLQPQTRPDPGFDVDDIEERDRPREVPVQEPAPPDEADAEEPAVVSARWYENVLRSVSSDADEAANPQAPSEESSSPAPREIVTSPQLCVNDEMGARAEWDGPRPEPLERNAQEHASNSQVEVDVADEDTIVAEAADNVVDEDMIDTVAVADLAQDEAHFETAVNVIEENGIDAEAEAVANAATEDDTKEVALASADAALAILNISEEEISALDRQAQQLLELHIPSTPQLLAWQQEQTEEPPPLDVDEPDLMAGNGTLAAVIDETLAFLKASQRDLLQHTEELEGLHELEAEEKNEVEVPRQQSLGPRYRDFQEQQQEDEHKSERDTEPQEEMKIHQQEEEEEEEEEHEGQRTMEPHEETEVHQEQEQEQEEELRAMVAPSADLLERLSQRLPAGVERRRAARSASDASTVLVDAQQRRARVKEYDARRRRLRQATATQRQRRASTQHSEDSSSA